MVIFVIIVIGFAFSLNSPRSRQYECKAIGVGEDDGFFSLQSFNGYLYAGGFGYNKKQFIYRYPPFESMDPGVVVHESIGKFAVFGEFLYANTENNAVIFRSKNGDVWKPVFDLQVNHTIGCGMAEFNGFLYASNYDNGLKRSGRIYRSNDGKVWTKVYDSGDVSCYVREVVVYKNKIIVFVMNENTNVPGYLVSSDGIEWDHHKSEYRFFRGKVFNKTLWIGTSVIGGIQQNPVLIKYDGSEFVKVAEFKNRSHISDIREHEGYIFVTTTVQWKGHQGGATLYVSDESSGYKHWSEVCVFAETESWNIEVYQRDLYISTKQDGGGGKLGKIYKLSKIE